MTVDALLSQGMTHAEFVEITDLLLKSRNYTRTELLDMTSEELMDVLGQFVETEKAVDRARQSRRR